MTTTNANAATEWSTNSPFVRVTDDADDSMSAARPHISQEHVMFIDPDLRAMIAARFDFVGTELTPGVPNTVAGRAAARSSVLRELVRLVYDQVKFSEEGSA